MFQFDYKKALYRRNNFGQPTIWFAEVFDYEAVVVYHGIIGKTIIKEFYNTKRKPLDEVKSKFNNKRKSGYKYLSELKDNINLPVERELYSYLDAYLPINRTTADGSLLPMLAKVYDNTNNKLFKKVNNYIGQYKINGVRCFISAVRSEGNLFSKYHLIFQSREGTYWNSLANLETYLLVELGDKLLEKMVEEHYILDGELYLPGYTVNDINHIVKDGKCKENKFIQFWCFDLAIENAKQMIRYEILAKDNNLFKHRIEWNSKEEHLLNNKRFVLLPIFNVDSGESAVYNRNKAIDLGFEGLILRNPDAEYQYGKRNLTMIKYKRSTDGKFKILNIYPEGIKRKDIPLFLLKNDVNNETFEVHLGGSMEYQANIFKNKDKYIGTYMFVEFGERSGVKDVPFHIKKTALL